MAELVKNVQPETVVGEHVKVTGKLATSGSIQINGYVRGEVVSEGTVYVGKTAKVSGPVSAQAVLIEGAVRGNIVAHEALELAETARLIGDIQTKALAIKAGATFVGKTTMPLEEEEKRKEETVRVAAPRRTRLKGEEEGPEIELA